MLLPAPSRSALAPAASPRAAHRGPPHHSSSGLLSLRRSILVAEEHPAVSRFITECLRREGYEVAQARDERSARTVVAALGRVDLLVAGGTSGPRLAAVLRHRRPALRALFAGSQPGGAGGEHTAEALPTMLLPKPFSRGDLLAAVHGLIGGPSPWDAYA